MNDEPSLLRSLLWRAAGCTAVSAAAAWWAGPVTFMTTVPLWGIAFARPLMDLAGAAWHRLRVQADASVTGLHFRFRGRTVLIQEDLDHWRWVPVDALRRLGGVEVGDATLRTTYPDHLETLGRPPALHLREDAALLHLARQPGEAPHRLRLWLDKEVHQPARRLRQRHGVRDDRPRLPPAPERPRVVPGPAAGPPGAAPATSATPTSPPPSPPSA